MNLNTSKSIAILKLNYRDLMIFIVPILIFSLYFFVYYPGVLTSASYSQLHQIAANKFTVTYPMFHTYLEMLCLKIFNSISVMGIFQILIFSLLWMVICKYHRNDLAQSSDEFVLQFIVTLIICLIPINAVYSITMSSNVLFSYSLLFLGFLIKILIDQNWQMDGKLTILIPVTLAIICGLNNYGIYIAAITLIAVTYYLYKQNASEQTFIRLIGLTVLCILIMSSFSLIYDVKGVNYDQFTLSEHIPSEDAFEEGINLENARNQFFSSSNFEPIEEYENTASTNIGSESYTIVDSFVNLFRGNFLLGGLFNNPWTYLILSIITLGLIYIITSKAEIYLVCLPVLLNTFIAVITGINNLYSNLLIFYIIVIMGISIYFKLGLKPQDITSSLTNLEANNSQYIKPQQQYEPEYSYIAPQQQSYEDDYSYIESEIENLTLDDINELLGESRVEDTPQVPNQVQQPKEEPLKAQKGPEEGDLIDEILKEIEMEKK